MIEKWLRFQLRYHNIGTDKKFVSLSDAIRAALRKLLDSLDEIDKRQGRGSQIKSIRKK
ncbi:MAG: hypothetical protein ACW97W_02175 [Candidatus Hodarchaeales archaeon]|jgi:Arc/MetJ-type ribon-helix-helix transcriptional regulator